jgi:glycosyltransferase involved in cell wall biosynthesis
LIKAFEKLRMVINCEMFIIGYGPEEMLLKDLINDLNLQKDIFLIPSSIDNYSILKSADVFPIASIWEGMVLTMIEAMFLGIPVVSTNFLCGPTFLIGQENERGWLVEENNLDLFHIALIEAIQNKNLANEKSKNAKKFVDENLSIDKQFRNYIDNFIEI